MAYDNFKRTIWSKHIQTELAQGCVLAEDCDYKFEGEAKKGNKVKIVGVARPTIGTYDGTDIGAPQNVTDNAQFLEINQADYFNFAVDDVDEAQSVEGLMPALMSESARALAEKTDTFIGSLAASDDVAEDMMSASTQISKSNVKGLIDTAFEKLWANGVKVNEHCVIDMTPKFYNLFKDNLVELKTNNDDLIKKGVIGMYNNAYVKLSNLLHNDGTDDYIMVRTKKAIAFADQIDETEAYRPEGLFSDAVKGLHVYGGKVVRPRELYVIKAH